jgi:hypothetical protein
MSTLKVTNLQKLDGTTFPVGKVGQVVQGTFSGTDTITSTSYVTTSLNASITPSSSSSKILITLGLTMDNNASMRADATIYRGGTNILNGLNNNNGLISFNSIANGRFIAMQSNSFLDSPSTTSSTTYTVYMKVQSSTVQLYGLEATSTITLMEVLA